MHEIKLEENSKEKIFDLEFGLWYVWKNDTGHLIARVHPPKKSELWEKLGDRFDLQQGDFFVVGKNKYLIEKIIEGKVQQDGKYENGKIMIKLEG